MVDPYEPLLTTVAGGIGASQDMICQFVVVVELIDILINIHLFS